MRVLFVVPQGPKSPGPRYRVYQFLPYYGSRGVECAVRAVQGPASTDRSLSADTLGLARRLLHYGSVWLALQLSFLLVIRAAHRFDLVYLYRVAVPAWAAYVLRMRSIPIVFDFDDAIDKGETGWAGLRGHVLRAGLRRAIAVSRGVIVSNARNAKVARALGRPICVIPTCVDLGRYPYRSRRKPLGEWLIVGWIGTPSTAKYLTLIEEPLRRLLDGHIFRILLVGAGRNPFRTIPAEIVPWSIETEVEAITSFDLGLMPMPDDDWASGKAALKGLQYGASGAPTVASLTETNAEILGADAGALFCASAEEWFRETRSLLMDGERREEMGRAGRERVERFFSLESQAPRLIDLIGRAGLGKPWEGG